MQKITPFLWFDNQALEAARFYTSIFKDSEILTETELKDVPAGPVPDVAVVHFTLNGQEFIALNGGPLFKFTEAVSFQIDCTSQEEVDYYWNGLMADGGEPSQCGWLKDKFGLSWQVVPRQLTDLLSDPDPERAKRAMNAMMGMQKIDVGALERAVEGEPSKA